MRLLNAGHKRIHVIDPGEIPRMRLGGVDAFRVDAVEKALASSPLEARRLGFASRWRRPVGRRRAGEKVSRKHFPPVLHDIGVTPMCRGRRDETSADVPPPLAG
ncbi:hypothetical protein EYF80_049073 [Liparis tanakae]|uniref:Uncharacterized protein n=1 Tax=Liparis tanakae TaxID=230148 RepID=A0A4Z2FHQ6_9TELE|nr:hypothetical protein EYF80_049073 [Liparis tanakae]